MIDKIKKSIRIKSNALDDELQDLINSAYIDLKISGVIKQDKEDPLIIQAVKMYCKANFGLDNKDSDKYQRAYNNLKEHLALCGEYNVD